MTYFAKLDSENVVLFMTAGRDDDEGREFALFERTGDVYRQTYIDGSARFNYAGIGFTYDENRDAFIPPQPFESWVLDEDTCLWVAPIAMPEGVHTWDEEAGDWVEVTDETV